MIYHNGHFVIIQSYIGSKHIPVLKGMRRLALVEVHDPLGKLPAKIDRRLKNYKRLVLCEDYLHPGMPKWIGEGYYKHYVKLAERFEFLWPLHILAYEWPLPREVGFEWPDHLVGGVE